VLSKIGVRFTKEYFKKRYRLEDSDFELNPRLNPTSKGEEMKTKEGEKK